jgi:hypothetical protein
MRRKQAQENKACFNCLLITLGYSEAGTLGGEQGIGIGTSTAPTQSLVNTAPTPQYKQALLSTIWAFAIDQQREKCPAGCYRIRGPRIISSPDD